MAWKFLLDDGQEVDLDRLPPALFDEIAKGDADASWFTVYRFPGASTSRLWRLYVEACKIAGVQPGTEPATLADTLKLLDRLQATPDIEDLPMENGFPPEQGTPETGLSSGVPEDSDGLPTSLDVNPSETS